MGEMKFFLLLPCIFTFKLSEEESNSFLKRHLFNEDTNDDLERECLEKSCDREELEEVYDFETGLFKAASRTHGHVYSNALACWKSNNDQEDRSKIRHCLDFFHSASHSASTTSTTTVVIEQTTDYEPANYYEDKDSSYDS